MKWDDCEWFESGVFKCGVTALIWTWLKKKSFVRGLFLTHDPQLAFIFPHSISLLSPSHLANSSLTEWIHPLVVWRWWSVMWTSILSPHLNFTRGKAERWTTKSSGKSSQSSTTWLRSTETSLLRWQTHRMFSETPSYSCNKPKTGSCKSDGTKLWPWIFQPVFVEKLICKICLAGLFISVAWSQNTFNF